MSPVFDHIARIDIAGLDGGLLLLGTCLALVAVLLVSLGLPRRQR